MSIRDMESDQNLQQQNGPAQGITSNIWSVFEAVWSFYQDADQDQNLRDIVSKQIQEFLFMSFRGQIISGTLTAWKEQSDFENEWQQYNNKCSEQSTSFHSEDTDQVVWVSRPLGNSAFQCYHFLMYILYHISIIQNNINAKSHNHLKIIDRVESRVCKNGKQFKGVEECIDDHADGSDVVMNYKLDPLVEAHAKYISEFYKEYP